MNTNSKEGNSDEIGISLGRIGSIVKSRGGVQTQTSTQQNRYSYEVVPRQVNNGKMIGGGGGNAHILGFNPQNSPREVRNSLSYPRKGFIKYYPHAEQNNIKPSNNINNVSPLCENDSMLHNINSIIQIQQKQQLELLQQPKQQQICKKRVSRNSCKPDQNLALIYTPVAGNKGIKRRNLTNPSNSQNRRVKSESGQETITYTSATQSGINTEQLEPNSIVSACENYNSPNIYGIVSIASKRGSSNPKKIFDPKQNLVTNINDISSGAWAQAIQVNRNIYAQNNRQNKNIQNDSQKMTEKNGGRQILDRKDIKLNIEKAIENKNLIRKVHSSIHSNINPSPDNSENNRKTVRENLMKIEKWNDRRSLQTLNEEDDNVNRKDLNPISLIQVSPSNYINSGKQFQTDKQPKGQNQNNTSINNCYNGNNMQSIVNNIQNITIKNQNINFNVESAKQTPNHNQAKRRTFDPINISQNYSSSNQRSINQSQKGASPSSPFQQQNINQKLKQRMLLKHNNFLSKPNNQEFEYIVATPESRLSQNNNPNQIIINPNYMQNQDRQQVHSQSYNDQCNIGEKNLKVLTQPDNIEDGVKNLSLISRKTRNLSVNNNPSLLPTSKPDRYLISLNNEFQESIMERRQNNYSQIQQSIKHSSYAQTPQPFIERKNALSLSHKQSTNQQIFEKNVQCPNEKYKSIQQMQDQDVQGVQFSQPSSKQDKNLNLSIIQVKYQSKDRQESINQENISLQQGQPQSLKKSQEKNKQKQQKEGNLKDQNQNIISSIEKQEPYIEDSQVDIASVSKENKIKSSQNEENSTRETKSIQQTSKVESQNKITPKNIWDLSEEEWNNFGDRFPKTLIKKKLLGRGGFALVWLGENMLTQEVFAVKQIQSRNSHQTHIKEIWFGSYFFKNGLPKEKFLQYRGINNLSTLMHYDIKPIDTWIYYELCGNSLGSSLYELKGEGYKGEDRLYRVHYKKLYTSIRNDLKQFKKLVFELAHALWLLSDQRIVHSDLKTENILVKTVDKGNSVEIEQVKLIDYGSSFTFGNLKHFSMATPEYMAPEILNYILYQNQLRHNTSLLEYLKDYQKTFVIDIWSLGCVMMEIVSGIPLWMSLKTIVVHHGQEYIRQGLFAAKGRVFESIIQKQLDVVGNIQMYIDEHNYSGIVMDQELSYLIKRMLSIDPSKRISPKEVCQYLHKSIFNTEFVDIVQPMEKNDPINNAPDVQCKEK